MPSDARAALLAAVAEAARALAGDGDALPMPAEGADTRAVIPVPIPQATGEDGRPRGVRVRALSARQRLDAEAAAHRYALRVLGTPPAAVPLREAWLVGYERVVERRQVIEEAALMLVEPPDVPAGVVERWSDAVIQQIHLAGVQAEGYPAELIRVEFARLHGGPPPPAPHTVADEPQPDPDLVAAAPA